MDYVNNARRTRSAVLDVTALVDSSREPASSPTLASPVEVLGRSPIPDSVRAMVRAIVRTMVRVMVRAMVRAIV